MTTSACLQAWVGTLFTYIRFYWGTRNSKNRRDYSKEIRRIEENRAWGQPIWAIYSFTVCCAILVFNGWSLFNQKNAIWVIYYSGDQTAFSNDQVLKFITTYAPIPIFIMALFGYKLICQTTMRRTIDMNFSGVAYPGPKPLEEKPESFWGRVWWTLVK
ncbi:hypothetical protein FRB90_002080 [Tulasnella sp. 427]|nr:hypothetical protein FRB90_002080 [Tulasnella sp. 427]